MKLTKWIKDRHAKAWILRNFRVKTERSISEETRRILVAGMRELLAVLESGGMPKFQDTGICYNLKEWCSRKHPESTAWVYVIPMIEGYSPGWFHYSGSPDFPIPGGEGAYHLQVRNGSMWKIYPDPRDHRISLLQFLLAHLSVPSDYEPAGN